MRRVCGGIAFQDRSGFEMNPRLRRDQGRKSKRHAGRRRDRAGVGGLPSGPEGPDGLGELDELLETAIADHEGGRLDAAERGYRGVLNSIRHPEALHLLGVVQLQRGHLDEAIATIGEAAELAPDQASYHYNLAEAYRMTGRLSDAISRYRRAIALEPKVADAHFNLGNTLFERGDLLAAARSFRRAHKIAPQDAEIALNLGNALLELGDAEAALALFHEAAQHLPENSGAHINVGTAFMSLGRVEEGLAAYRRAVGATDRPETAMKIGDQLLRHGQPIAALEFLKLSGSSMPDDAEHCAMLARAFQETGRVDEAVSMFERALDIDPRLVSAHQGIAESVKFTADDPRIGRLEAILENPTLASEPRSGLLFSLATMLDDAHAYERAFSAAAEANRLRRRQVRSEPQDFAAAVDQLIQMFTADFFTERDGFGAESQRPVFIVGMPHSGSTLAERILAGHGEVAAGGEREDVRQIIAGLPLRLGPGSAHFPFSIAAIKRELSDTLGGLIDGIFANLAPEAARFTDRSANTFTRLAFIALTLPKARVIHCRRDPVETCLSCFFDGFGPDLVSSHDLNELGRHYRDYERLAAHWRAVLPLDMLEIEFEQLTADPETVSRQMLAFCGLDWDPSCLTPHNAGNAIRTTGPRQARQPAVHTPVPRRTRYKPHLEPLFNALGRGTDD